MTATVTRTLGALYRAHRPRMLLTYALSLLENVFDLLYPLATGLAIDGLLAGRFAGLALFAGVWLAHTVTGVVRQRFDTRTFTHIYGELAARMVAEQVRRGLPTSQVVARSALAREVVDFFERDVPGVLGSLVGFAGALGMLFVYDRLTGLACLALLVPVALFSRPAARRALTLNRKLNDELEREVDVLSRPRGAAVRDHYRRLARWRVRLSDTEAAHWGVLELFLIVLAGFVFVRAAGLPNAQPGTIYAVIAYLWNFMDSLAGIPFLVQQLARLRDITGRMELEAGGGAGAPDPGAG
ncbi:ABC transporter six-transmembrane domain-containing protein [Deinococcus apachensis]|uniref:ABC transporter six-transmembrane domain-containing protein n=1 Tax=Deinococcus apachensis TaxID=309886 RepID=UPI000368144E|nr:ABC transporter six-transmembrane domain-containing protein [Deinococcus apachensis]